MNKIKEIILAHNSFFGINHLDNETGRQKLIKKFGGSKNIIEILNYSVERKLNNFMISTVDESKNLIGEINNDQDLKNNLNFFVLLPYINKYVRKTNELGIIGVLKETISNQNILKLGMDALSFISSADYKKIVSNLIDFEIKPFVNNNIKCIILHDSLTDILVALKKKDVLDFYDEYIKTKFNCRSGFATKNLPQFLDLIGENSYKDTSILTHVNKIGYEMNPNQKIVEDRIRNSSYNIICMSVLASGHLNFNQAIEYIHSLNVKSKLSTVIGCSSKEHINDYSQLIVS